MLKRISTLLTSVFNIVLKPLNILFSLPGLKIVKQYLASPEVRKKIIFTLFILVIYRMLANVPLPGIDMEVYQSEFANKSTSETSFLLTVFTGGLLQTPSIVGLGIGVYITASIIMQLLGSVIPKLEELQKEGKRGQQVIDQYTRLLTLPLSAVYSVAYLIYLASRPLGTNAAGEPQYLIPRVNGDISILKIAFMAIVLTAGSILIMWLAEQITEYGISKGASIMITLGILSSLPALVSNDLSSIAPLQAISEALQGTLSALTDPGLVALYLIIGGGILLVVAIVYINESTRKLPIQYASRQRGAATQGSHLPLKLNQTGVMPIIFASSLVTVPRLIVPLLSQVVPADSPLNGFVNSLQTSFLFDTTSVGYSIFYVLMIAIFAFFYIFISFKPSQVAENLQKSGAFIPGIRPGKSTEQYITKVLIRLTSVGALFLGVIALIPILAGNILNSYAGQQFTLFSAIGGTSILIIVGVVLEAMRKVRSMRDTQNYDRFIYQ